MSGVSYTYTTVSRTELERLRKRAQDSVNLANLNSELAAMLHSVQTDTQTRIRDLTRIADNLEHQLDVQSAATSKERQQLRDQIKRTVEQTNAALSDMAAKNEQALNDQAQHFTTALLRQKEDTAHAIKESHDQLQAEMNAAVNDLNSRIDATNSHLDSIDHQLSTMAGNNSSLLDQAREFSDSASTILSAASQLRLDLLLPGRHAQAQQTLAEANSNIALADKNPANASVARLTASQAAKEALQLYQDAMHAEQMWQQAWQQAAQSLNAAEAQIEACRHYKLPIEFEDGTTTTYNVESDHWTNGDLAQLSERLAALKDQLRHADNNLTANSLDHLREAGIQLTHEAVENADFALEALYASQDRVEYAADLLDTVAAKYGLQVQSHGYQGNDTRGMHYLCLKNPVTGLQVAVTQTPTLENGQLANRVQAEILDYGTTNPAASDQLTKQILEDLGIEAPVHTASSHTDCNDQPHHTASALQREWQKPLTEADCPKPEHTAFRQSQRA